MPGDLEGAAAVEPPLCTALVPLTRTRLYEGSSRRPYDRSTEPAQRSPWVRFGSGDGLEVCCLGEETRRDPGESVAGGKDRYVVTVGFDVQARQGECRGDGT